VQEFVGGAYLTTYHARFSSELDSEFYWRKKNLDLRIVRVVDGNGLCSIGWDVNQRRPKNSFWVKTFNIYTYEFGTMFLPSQSIPRHMEESARGMWEQDGPFELEFSLDHQGIVEHYPGCIYDDNFDILFGDYGYVVWCFNEDLKLPIVGSLSDDSMELAPSARPLPLNRRLQNT
jgi:hypothetical protein